MNKRLIIRCLLVVLAVLAGNVCHSVVAQTDQHEPDTMYYQYFGCDSFQLTLNDIPQTYYADTVILDPVYTTVQGHIELAVLNIHQIHIGQSYNMLDTLSVSICKSSLPYYFNRNYYTQSGNYWVDFPTVAGCDSAHVLLQLQVLEGQHDTAEVAICPSQTSVMYDGIRFWEPGYFTMNKGIDTNGCPILRTYHVTRYALETDTIEAAICYGQTYVCKGVALDSAGVYDIPYVTETGCEGSVHLTLSVNSTLPEYRPIDTTVCAADLPFVYLGRQYTRAGNYPSTIQNQYGCDSVIVNLYLTVTMPQIDTVIRQLCAEEFPYTYDSLHTYSTQGKYFINEAPDQPCQHYTLLMLRQKPSVHDTLNICTSDSTYTFEDSTFTQSTVYTYTDTNSLNCLDYHTVRVNLNQQTVYDTVSASVCVSDTPYMFYGHACYRTGIYTHVIPNQFDCDSVSVSLWLTVKPDPVISVYDTITRNDLPYVYRGHSYTQSGVYQVVAPSTTQGDCDTTYVLNLYVQPIYTCSVDTTVCANVAVAFLGDTLTSEGSYQFVYHMPGYDSVITLQVHHYPTYNAETVYAEVGEYELPYHFMDSLYYAAGYYEVTLATVHGCDSVFSLSLTINPAIVNPDTTQLEICSNELPLTYNDSVLTQAGVYRYIVPSSTPAVDSVYYVNLAVKESPTLVIADTSYLCVGGSVTLTAQSTGSVYLWNNGSTESSITVTLAGQYSVTVSNAFECSTTANVQVIQVALPDAHISGSNTVCEGSSLTLIATGGTNYLWSDGGVSDTLVVTPTANTTYYVTVSNIYGCSRTKDFAVSVNSLPEVTIMGRNSICDGEFTTYTANGADTYRWSTGGRTNQITVMAEGVYTVTGTDANQCENTASVVLEVHPLPTIQTVGRTSFCPGVGTTISALGASQYIWSSGDVGQSISVSYAGTYTVTGTDQHGCFSTKSVFVTQSSVNASIENTKTICPGQSTTLTVTGDESNTYRWFNGNTSNTVTVSAPGVYSVTVTNANGCQNTLSSTVTEKTVTVPTINGKLTICEGETTTLRASGGNSYVWDDGSTQAYITVGTTGIYSVTATNNGCTASNSVTVMVNPAPDVNILPQNATICRGDNISITAISNANTYNWTSGQTTAAINVSPVSNTTYTVMVTDENECKATASIQVTVNPLPSAYIEGPNSICQGDTAVLTASGGVEYLWNTGQSTPTIKVTNSNTYSVEVIGANGCTASTQKVLAVNALPVASVTESVDICRGQDATLSANAPVGCTYQWSTGSQTSQTTVQEAGQYGVTVTNADNCSRSYLSNVIVHDPPQVDIAGSSEFCEGQSTTLMASGVGITQYQWSTGDQNASVTVYEGGSYGLTATNAYGCFVTATRTVTKHPLPQPQITGELSVCKGSSTTLTATGGVSYLWSTNNTGSQLTVSPAISQSYSVTVSSSHGCIASTSATVTVNQLPQIFFNGNTILCDGATATITAAGASTYYWSTGAQTASINVSQQGYYKVTGTNAQNCSKSDSVYVTVNPKPQVHINGDNHVCAGSVSTLTATGAETYMWNTQEISEEISIAPLVTTTYIVTGYDTNGCYSTVQKVVNVEPVPQVQILGERTICRGQSTVLTAVGGTSYRWSNNITEQEITVTPNINTTYSVSAYNDFGCVGAATATVNVNMLPSISFSGNTSICEGQSTTITATGGNSYQWSNGTVGNAITVSEAGTYSVSVTNSLNCMRTDSVEVVVYDNPVVLVGGQSLICQGAPATLTATGANTYVWSTGETGSVIIVMPEETSSYSVVGYDENGCSATVSKVVNVEVAPDVYISGNLSICHGEFTTLTASAAHSYLWSTGATTDHITVSNYGAYTVTASSVNGCQSVASATVVDNPNPVFTIHGVPTICENTTAVISVSGENTYEWSTGSTETAITITQGGTYTVTATNNYGCQLTSGVTVTQLAAPVLSIVGVDALCQGDSTILMAFSNANQYLWSTGDTTNSVTVTPDNTLYTVTVTGENGCITEAEHLVTTLPTYNISLTGSICEHQSFSDYGFDIPAIDSAGTYAFTRGLQTVAGCDSIVNLLLTVNPLPRLDTINGPQNIVMHGNSFFSVNNPQYVNTYEWRVTNTHWTLSNSNYNNVTLNVPVNGSGTLYARGINSCGFSEISLSLYCNVGIEDYPTQTLVRLYPNPVHQSLYIDLNGADEVSKVALFDEAGRRVYQADCTDSHMEIDCTRFANGHYTVQLLDEKGRRVESRKIVVKNK